MKTQEVQRILGQVFQDRVENMGIEEVKIAPRSPGQTPYAERLIGSIRRECLDHVIVLNERHLKRILTDYLLCANYYFGQINSALSYLAFVSQFG